MANPDLPEEILLEIFSRIPTKTVGKFRTLSKSWNSHLSTSNFIKKHLIIRKLTIKQQNLALVTEDNTLFIFDEMKNSSLVDTECFRVFGSCNGLILLGGFYGKDLILLNPVTRKQVNIQTPSQEFESFYSFMYGFGYDRFDDDYKVVKLCLRVNVHTTSVYVYSVKIGVWKKVDGCYPYGTNIPSSYGFEGGAFVNGSIHWLIRDGDFRCITAFDLVDEVFREIPVPGGFRKEGNVMPCLDMWWRATGLSVAEGCLLIVDNLGEGETDVWMLKEYGVAESWVRFSIDVGSQWRSLVAVMCFVEDRRLLCLTSEEFLFVCDLESRTVEKVIVDEGNSSFSHGMVFVDSLVSPY